MMSPTALGHLEDLVEYLKREATVERRTLLRKAITDELGLSDATQDDILKAIRELRANGAEDARQLTEARAERDVALKSLGEVLDACSFSPEELTAKRNEALVASGTGFRKEVADALGLIDPDDAMILLWIAGIRADGAEDDRQLTLARAERDLAQAEHARIQARWERDNEHHLSMMRRVREFLTEDKL